MRPPSKEHKEAYSLALADFQQVLIDFGYSPRHAYQMRIAALDRAQETWVYGKTTEKQQ